MEGTTMTIQYLEKGDDGSVVLLTPYGVEREFDATIAPLLQAMWRREWEVFNGRYDGDHCIIELDAPTAEKFLTLICRQDQHLYEQASRPISHDEKSTDSERWYIAVLSCEGDYDIENGGWRGPPK
jgi:hypothetical protein